MILSILAPVNKKTVVPLTIHYGTREKDQTFLFIFLSCFYVELVRRTDGRRRRIYKGRDERRIPVSVLDILSLGGKRLLVLTIRRSLVESVISEVIRIKANP